MSVLVSHEPTDISRGLPSVSVKAVTFVQSLHIFETVVTDTNDHHAERVLASLNQNAYCVNHIVDFAIRDDHEEAVIIRVLGEPLASLANDISEERRKMSGPTESDVQMGILVDLEYPLEAKYLFNALDPCTREAMAYS